MSLISDISVAFLAPNGANTWLRQ